MAKFEYEVKVTNTRVHRVFVEADDWEEAKDKAIDEYYKYCEDETSTDHVELIRDEVDAEVDWSNEED